MISDTHGRVLPASLPELFAGCEFILHAGDIGSQMTIEELELMAPVRAVLGNNDYAGMYISSDGQVTDRLYFAYAGFRIFMTHRPTQLPDRAKLALDAHTKLLLVHGHTHVPRFEEQDASYILCPGSIARPRAGSKPSVAVVSIEGDRLSVEFHEVS